MILRDIRLCLSSPLTPQTGTGYISWFSASDGWQFDVYMNKIDKDGNLHWGEEGLLISDNPTDTWVTDYDLIIDDETVLY